MIVVMLEEGHRFKVEYHDLNIFGLSRGGVLLVVKYISEVVASIARYNLNILE